MSRVLRRSFLIPKVALGLAMAGVGSREALASHTETLLGVGSGSSVSPFGLVVGAAIAFLVLGSLIVLGLRHLHDQERKSGEEKP